MSWPMALIKLVFLALFIIGFVYDFVITISTQLEHGNLERELPEEDQRCPQCPSCSGTTRPPWSLSTRPSTVSGSGLPPCDDGAVAAGSGDFPDFEDVELGSPDSAGYDSGVGVETVLVTPTSAPPGTASVSATASTGSLRASTDAGSVSGSLPSLEDLHEDSHHRSHLFTQEEVDAAVKLAQDEFLVSKNII